MKEDLLQYIWQYQLFDKKQLRTADGQSINIIKVGLWNNESGPDFLQAQIKIDDMVWFGSVEIHINASDWSQHKHHLDPAFDNVILHVVWEPQKSILHQDGTKIPTLILKDKVNALLLKKYELLLESKHTHALACSNYLSIIPSLQKFSVLEKAALSRIERKSTEILQIWETLNKDWQQAAFQWICRAYGFKVNAEAFATLGAKLPFSYLLKERTSVENILALLFEVSGLKSAHYCSDKVMENARHLGKKYRVETYVMQRHEFRWSRLRPVNFPEIRLIQLAVFIYQNPNPMDLLLHMQSVEAMYAHLDSINKIIREHKRDFPKARVLGKESIYHIMINAVVPFRYAFGMQKDDEQMKESAVNLLQEIPAEQNRFIRVFLRYDFPIKTALESQGVLEHHLFSCQEKRCLTCHIGVAIMKNHDLVLT